MHGLRENAVCHGNNYYLKPVVHFLEHLSAVLHATQVSVISTLLANISRKSTPFPKNVNDTIPTGSLAFNELKKK